MGKGLQAGVQITRRAESTIPTLTNVGTVCYFNVCQSTDSVKTSADAFSGNGAEDLYKAVHRADGQTYKDATNHYLLQRFIALGWICIPVGQTDSGRFRRW